MSCTAVKRVLIVASCSIAFGWTSLVIGASIESEASAVARLYKDFAWQAMASQAELFGEDVTHQSKANLGKYFTPALADLLARDAACQIASGGICNLEVDLLFDSQDPRVTDLEITRTAPGKVTVSFKDPVADRTTRIDFLVVRTAGRWRIADMVYHDPGELSLKQLLSRKLR